VDRIAEGLERKFINLTWWSEAISFTCSKVGFVNDIPRATTFLHWLLGGYIDEVMVDCGSIHLVATSNAASVL
jgi:hypothetical protein